MFPVVCSIVCSIASAMSRELCGGWVRSPFAPQRAAAVPFAKKERYLKSTLQKELVLKTNVAYSQLQKTILIRFKKAMLRKRNKNIYWIRDF